MKEMMNRFRLVFGIAAFLVMGISSPRAADLHGRVIDRGTLRPDGSARGISGVQISVYDGKRNLGSAITGARGQYRIRKVTAGHCRATYRARGYFPATVTREYSPLDTLARDVYLDADREEPAASTAKGKTKPDSKSGGYYSGVAHGLLFLAHLPAFFRESAEDSVIRMSAYFDARDSSEDYVGVFAELLWEEFQTQHRPLETRYYLAAALAPLLDSVGWGKARGMSRYLDVTPDAVHEAVQALQDALRDPKRIPGPKEARKLRVSPALLAQLAGDRLAGSTLPDRFRNRFLAQWKKIWGQELAPPGEAIEDSGIFSPGAVIAGLAAAKPRNQEVQYLLGRGLYAQRNYDGAVNAFSIANRLAGSLPSARYLEAMALIKLGREQEALGRFQALRESPSAFWKAKAFIGLALLEEREQRHAEAAGDLWHAQKLIPEAETVYLLAEASLKLTTRADVEKLLQAQADARGGDARAQYWLGRYAEENQQSGVAEDHYRKAWDASPAPEFAEALSRLYLSRDEFANALALLEPMRGRLTDEGRKYFAQCLFQSGRVLESVKEFQIAYAGRPTPELLAQYVDALVLAGRSAEGLALASAFPDQTHPLVRFAVAKSAAASHNPDRAQPILEELVKADETKAEYHFYLGLCHYENHAWDKAKSEFQDALQYRQDYLEATYFSGLCLVKLGNAQGARNLFNELSSRNSADWKAKGFLGVGLAFASEGKPDAAENFLRKSLDAVETAEAEAALALSMRRNGGPETWVPLAKKAYALDPNQPRAVLAMAEVLIALGKKTPALSLLKKAADVRPKSCELLLGLDKAQYLTGAYPAARVTGTAAMEACPQEPSAFFYAALSADKLQSRKEAEDAFKGYRKAGGDMSQVPEAYR